MADAAAWATEAVPTDRPNMTTRIVTGVEMECEAARGRTVPHAAITGTRSVTATICKTYAARVTGTLPDARYCDLDEWRLFARPILQGTSKPNPLAESSASPTSETPTEGDGGGWSGNGIARRARVKRPLAQGSYAMEDAAHRMAGRSACICTHRECSAECTDFGGASDRYRECPDF